MLFFHRQNARQKPLQVKIPAASGGALEGRSLSCWGNLSPKPPNKDAIPPHRKQWGILASFRDVQRIVARTRLGLRRTSLLIAKGYNNCGPQEDHTSNRL